MKSFVVMTYYQLMHAIAMTLEMGKKTDLYFNMDYLKVENDFLLKIKETKIFNRVVGMDSDEYKTPYNAVLKTCQKMTPAQIDLIGNRIFEKHLEPYYARKFSNADFYDEIYVYNDFQRYFYYIAKHFKNIVGVEDGYKSLKQQLTVHWFKGTYKWVEPFLGKYYPEPLYKNNHIKKIISSCAFDDLPEYYNEKIEVIDFKDIVENNLDQYVNAITHIFDLEDIDMDEDDTLILTTPLSRSRHCNSLQNFLFYKKLIEKEKKEGKKIYIKPHPADTLVAYDLYEDEQVKVLPRNFPVEILQYKKIKVGKTISFASTALMNEIGEKNVTLYKGPKNVKAINKYILKYISDYKLKLNIYIWVDELSPEIYINVRSYIRQHGNIDMKLKVIIPKGSLKEYREYFHVKNMERMIKAYKKYYKIDEEKMAYCYEIEHLADIKIENLKYVSMEFLESPISEEGYIYHNFIKNDLLDYFFFVDAHNLGLRVISKLAVALRDNIKFVYTFSNYTFLDDDKKKKIYLGNGQIQNTLSGILSNRLWSDRANQILQKTYLPLPEAISAITDINSEDIQYRAILMLYLRADCLAWNRRSKAFFRKKIEGCVKKANADIDCLAGRVAMELSEYYNWLSQFDSNLQKGEVAELIERLEIDDEIKMKSQSLFIEALLRERQIERSRNTFGKIELYNYFNGTIQLLFRTGIMRRTKNWAVKIQSSKKKYAKKTRTIIKKAYRLPKKLRKKLSDGKKEFLNGIAFKRNEKHLKKITFLINKFINVEIERANAEAVDSKIIHEIICLNPKYKDENTRTLSILCEYLQVVQKKTRMSIDETTDNEELNMWTDFFITSQSFLVKCFSEGYMQKAVRILLISNLNMHKINQYEELLETYNSSFSSFYKCIVYKAILNSYCGRLNISEYILPLFREYSNDFEKYKESLKNLSIYCTNMHFLSRELKLDIFEEKKYIYRLHERIKNRENAWVYEFYVQLIRYNDYLNLVKEWLSNIFARESHTARYKKANLMYFARRAGKRAKSLHKDTNINEGGGMHYMSTEKSSNC